jgi:hypothetical protein
MVVRQELELEKHQQRDRPGNQADLRDQPQHEPHGAGADFARPGEELHEDVARQLATEASAGVLVGDLFLELGMEGADLAGKHHEMQQRVGVDDQEQQRPEHEKAEQRQVDVEERQLDRVLEEHVPVGDPARGDRKIEEHKKVAQPQPRPDTRGIDHRIAQGLKVLRFGGEPGLLGRRRSHPRFASPH